MENDPENKIIPSILDIPDHLKHLGEHALKEREEWLLKKKLEDPEILSFSELMSKEFPEVLWDVEGLFESGTINMISAPPNQYKSWVAQAVAISLAKGTNLFGKFKTKKQKVLIVNEEDNLRMMKDRSLMMLEEMEDLDIYFMVGSGFKIDDETMIDIWDEASQRGVTFIIFDSLRSIHSANENDSQEMQAVMDCFKYLTGHGITVFFTHHNRKKALGKFKDDSGEESRGSTAINASIHGHISCEESFRDDGKYLIISQKKLKCDKKMDPFLVKVDMDLESDKMKFVYSGEYDSKEDSFRKNKEAIFRIIENSTGWLSKKEISEMVSLGNSATSKVLQELEKESLVQAKQKKDLEKAGIKFDDQESKHNAKFYFRKEESLLDEFIEDTKREDAF